MGDKDGERAAKRQATSAAGLEADMVSDPVASGTLISNPSSENALPEENLAPPGPQPLLSLQQQAAGGTIEYMSQDEYIIFGRDATEESLKKMEAMVPRALHERGPPKFYTHKDDNMSRCHAIIFFRDGKFYLRPLTTKNRLRYQCRGGKWEDVHEKNSAIAEGEAGDWPLPLKLQFLSVSKDKGAKPLQVDFLYKELLCFTANPNVAPLNASREVEFLKDTCQWENLIEAYHGGDMQVLKRALRTPTRRFIFIGHADAKGPDGSLRLGLTKPGGGLAEMPPLADVAATLAISSKVMGGMLECCFFNGCCSEELGRTTRDGADMECVVCWRTKTLNTAARAFSVHFFGLVAEGKSYEDAFRFTAKYMAEQAVTLRVTLGEPPPGPPTPPYVGGIPVLLLRRPTGTCLDLVAKADGSVVQEP